jgi:hypothetical protein
MEWDKLSEEEKSFVFRDLESHVDEMRRIACWSGRPQKDKHKQLVRIDCIEAAISKLKEG